MSSCDSSVWDDSSSDEEYDLADKEDTISLVIALLVMMHKKGPKHGGYVFGREHTKRTARGSRKIDGQLFYS